MHLENKHGFAELCLQCDKWITDAVEWQNHCQQHVDNYEELPAQFNQIKYRYTPATAAQCMFCLFNPKLLATIRYKQYKNIHYWKEHLNNHFLELELAHISTIDEAKAVPCPDPRCSLAFGSVNELRYHSQDAHCCDLQKFTPRASTNRALSKKGPNCFSVPTGLDEKTRMNFVNETVETIPSLCLEPIAPKDDTGIKRKRGRPRKQCVKSSEEPRSPSRKSEPGAKTKRGRPRKYGSKPSQASPPIVQQKLGIKVTRGRPRRRYSASSSVSSYRSASSQSHDVPYLESEDELEISTNESESDSDYVFVESSESFFPQGGYWVSNKRRRKNSHVVLSTRATPQVVIHDAGHTGHADPGIVTPVNAKLFMLGKKNKKTQQTNQLRRDNLVGVVTDGNVAMDAGMVKCDICSKLEMQAKLDTELNRVWEAGALPLPLPGDVTKEVWVRIEDKNRDGLVRWYPCHGARVGFAVIVDSEGMIEALRAFAKGDSREHAGDSFLEQVVDTLGYGISPRRTVQFSPPSKELNGLVACKHFKDIQSILEKEVENTNSLMDLIASRR